LTAINLRTNFLIILCFPCFLQFVGTCYYLAFEMSTTADKSSRKWHPEQEKLFVELLSLPDYKPIGGSGDGVMERKQDTRWAPLLARFSLENEGLVAGERKKASGLGFKEGFNIMGLIIKYKSLWEKYMSLKRDFKVDRHQVSGGTGAAADGQPATAQAAIDAATEAWPCCHVTITCERVACQTDHALICARDVPTWNASHKHKHNSSIHATKIDRRVRPPKSAHHIGPS
jgi:hypothetical protein